MKTKRLRGSSQRRIEYGGNGEGAGEDVLYNLMPSRWLSGRWICAKHDEYLAIRASVAAARATDRRLKARSRGRMNRILDITYQAIRRRPEIFMGLLLLLTVFAGGCKGHDYTVNAVVADKFYSPSSTGTGVGMPMGKGGPNLVVTTTPEQYTLFLRFDDGQTVAESVSRDTWVRFERGAQVLVRCNSIWGIESIDRSQQ